MTALKEKFGCGSGWGTLFARISVATAVMLAVAIPSQAENASQFANFQRYAVDNAVLPENSGGRIVLMGNSITDFWPQRGAHLFYTHPEIIGRGIAGQTSFQFLLRFRQDVVDLHPEIVVINYGTNDIAENSGPYNEDVTFGNVKSMADIARANGIKVILASCLPAEGFSWRPEIKDAMPKIKSLNAKVREYAENEGIPFVDYFSALVNPEGTAMDSKYADETPAVHPNKAGYAVMEELLMEAINEIRPSKVSGQIYPKRRDDISYENELVGFRIYGPGTQQAGEKAYGYDIFFKYPTERNVLPEMYKPETDPDVWARVDSLRAIDPKLADEFINSFSYHVDHGLGMDCYAVGPTLGAGVSAIATADSIWYPWCYDMAEILENGPDRFSVYLKFAPRSIAGSDDVVENRIITLGQGSHLNHTKVWYEGLQGEQTVVAGFPLRDDSKPFADVEKGLLAYADPTQGPDNGRALLGIIFPGGAAGLENRDGHVLLSRKLQEGEALEYYWGFAWDRTDIKTMEEWQKYLEKFSNSL